MISRRDVVKLGAAGLVAPSFGSAIPQEASLAQVSGNDVPMFRGNAARTGAMPGPMPSPDEPMVVKWRFAMAESVTPAAPIVVDGTVFIANVESNDEDTSTHSILYAIDSTSARERWRFSVEGSFAATPAVDAGTAFFGVGNSTSSHAVDAILYAVDATSGEEQWRFAADGWFDSPAAEDGMVFIANHLGNLFAIDATSGEERWRFDSGDRADTSPAVVGNTVFLASQGHLYAIDATSGEELWNFDTGGVSTPSPAVFNGVVYTGGGQLLENIYVHAIDASTGVELWRFPIEGGVWTSSPAVADDAVYIGSDGFMIYAIDAAAGEERWHLGTENYDDKTSPVVVDGTVFTSWGGAGLALDAATGEERWRIDPENWYPRFVAVVDGTIFVRSLDGYLRAVGNLRPTVLTSDATIRAAPSDGALERGTAKTGDEIDHVGAREERNGQTWAEVTIGDVTGWIPLDTIDPATLPPEGEIEYVYRPE